MTNMTQNPWNVETVRLTAFIQPNASLDNPNSWWQNVVGTAPDTSINKPKEGITQFFGTLVELDAQLILSLSPERIDWQITPLDNEQATELPVVGEFKDNVVPVFQKLMSLWLEQYCPSTYRLAFGGILLNNIPDRVSGYKLLQDYIPEVKIDVENSSDFFYGINRPRQSSTIDNMINRLSRWTVIIFKSFQIPVNTGSKVEYLPRALAEESTACRLELDVNVVPTSAEAISKEKLVDVLDELISFSVDISENGNRP